MDSEPCPASLARRLGAVLYDTLLLLALWLVLGLIFLGLTFLGLIFLGGDSQWQSNLVPVQFVANLVLAWGFFVWFWTHSGQTLGMQTWSLHLLTASGGPVTLWPATVRYLVALAQWLLLLLGLHLARTYGAPATIAGTALLLLGLGASVLHPRRQMLHDWLSGTQLQRIAQQPKQP